MEDEKTIYFLEGKSVKLRPVLKTDLPVIFQWYNSDKLQTTTSHHRYPNTIEKQQILFDRQSQDNSHLQLAVIKKGEIVGTVTLFQINHLDQKAELSVHVFDSTREKTKIAIEAVSLLIHHGFSALNLNKIYVGLMEGLEGWGSILMDFFKFAEEGRKRQDVFKNGKFVDIILLSLLKSDYLELLKNKNGKILDQ